MYKFRDSLFLLRSLILKESDDTIIQSGPEIIEKKFISFSIYNQENNK